MKLRNWDQYREDQEKEKEIANCWTGWKDQNSELLRQEISNTSSTKLKNKEQCRATCTKLIPYNAIACRHYLKMFLLRVARMLIAIFGLIYDYAASRDELTCWLKSYK